MKAKADLVRNYKPYLMELKWATDQNFVDCGVFCMRHMETFMGSNGPDWNSGFSKNSTKTLINLRELYMQAIVKSSINEVKDNILGKIKTFSPGLTKV